jgi:hypothetical protein
MDISESYNKFTTLPQIPYNVISYLMEHDNEIFKLLKYQDADAWKSDADHPNLSMIEKAELIYDGKKEIGNSNIFLNLGLDEAITRETSFLRIGMPEISANNHIRGTSLIGFEILTHYKVSTLSNYQSRDDTILQRLLEVLNGVDIPGIGRIYFDSKINNRCRAYMIGQIPYRGKALMMATNILG